jgi:hypothetical protein
MTGTRRPGRGAAVAATAIGIALWFGAGAARADELADLKANQQLLQQQIDQLALGAPAGVPPPGAASLAGSFPRSFLIPGTDTSLLIGGYVQFSAADYLEGGSPNSANAAGPPVTGIAALAGTPLNLHGTGIFAPPFFNPHSRGNGVIRFAASQSRLRIETRTPTAWGQAQTVFEFDSFGCTANSGSDCNNTGISTNGILPRLRLAYGTLGGFIAGQNWTPIDYLDAGMETLDFSGQAGDFGYARVPQIGYKFALPYGQSFGGYLVNPIDQVYTPVGGIEDDSLPGSTPGSGNAVLPVNPTKNTYPAVNLVWHINQPWGGVQVGGVLNPLKLEDGAVISKNYLGYGGGIAWHVTPGWFGFPKDNFGGHVYAGSGLGHFATPWTGSTLNGQDALATNFGGCQIYPSTGGCIGPLYGSVANPTGAGTGGAAVIRAATITQYGGNVNAQHFWAPGLRTNIGWGVSYQDVPTTLVGINATTINYNRELMTVHLNLLWSPVAFINTGIEYIWGERRTIANLRGTLQDLQFGFQVKF